MAVKLCVTYADLGGQIRSVGEGETRLATIGDYWPSCEQRCKVGGQRMGVVLIVSSVASEERHFSNYLRKVLYIVIFARLPMVASMCF